MDARVAQYKEQGNESMKRQDYHSAINLYKKGLAIDSNNPILNCNVSQAYLNLKNFNEAEKYAKKAIEHQRDYTKAYFRAAKAALERHDVFECMIYLARGVENCHGGNLEELFCMAGELSEEFEKVLRNHSKTGVKKETDEDDMIKPKSGFGKEGTFKPTGLGNFSERDKKETEREKGNQEAEFKRSKEQEESKVKHREKEEIERKKAEQEREKEEKRKKEAQEKQLFKKKTENCASLLSEVKGQMKEGSMALLKGLNRKAVDCFKKVLDITGQSPHSYDLDDMDVVVVRFAFSQALILSDEYKDVVKGIQMLESLENDGKHTKIPAIFLLLGRAFMRLNRFEYAQSPLERGLLFVNRGTPLVRYSWPGTIDVIDLTDRDILKKALQEDLCESKIYHRPDFTCCYKDCLSTSQHMKPSNHIFFSDLDFVGYVSLECQERCFTHFHISCWKFYKESLSEYEKFSEKDILGRSCITPDCLTADKKPSVIIKVSIFGPDGEEKSTCKYNPIISTRTMSKDISKVSEKSPRKKPLKKKETEKIMRNTEKKTKLDSKLKNESSNINQHSEVVAVSNEERLGDAVNKLALAREKNFGYGADMADPRKSLPVTTATSGGNDEEFIYTFFFEIFKKDGFMSLEKLKEHWEANKEILPELQPALVTFTDLARFLVDSKIFAIVHDTIGLASDLPDIYAVVQAQSEIPDFVKAKSWEPSPATTFELSKSLTFNSTCSEEPNADIVDVPHSSSSTSSASDSASCSLSLTPNIPYNSSILQQNSVLKEIEMPLGTKDYGPNNSSILQQHSVLTEIELPLGTKDCGPNNSSILQQHSVLKEIEVPLVTKDCGPNNSSILQHHSALKEIQVPFGTKDCGLNNSSVLQQHSALKEIQLPFGTKDFGNEHQRSDILGEVNERSVSKAVESIQSKVVVPSEIISDKNKVKHLNGEVYKLCNGESRDSEAKVMVTHKKVQWKPRAKLLEWATATFPNESQARLWKALTLVRAHNNNTLSQLSFDAIGSRVQETLLKLDEEIGAFQ